MPLPAEQVYNDLNGEEVRDILITRFCDLIDALPEIGRRHLVLPRVRMSLHVVLEIANRKNVVIDDDVVVRVREMPPDLIPGVPMEASAIVDSYTEPPDKVREEHNLPVPTVTLTPTGNVEVPVHRPEAAVYKDTSGRRVAWAASGDRGAPISSGQVSPEPRGPGSKAVSADRDGPPAQIQSDFREFVRGTGGAG